MQRTSQTIKVTESPLIFALMSSEGTDKCNLHPKLFKQLNPHKSFALRHCFTEGDPQFDQEIHDFWGWF